MSGSQTMEGLRGTEVLILHKTVFDTHNAETCNDTSVYNKIRCASDADL